MLLVLKLVLSTPVELDHLLAHFIWETLIAAVLRHLLLEIVSHQGEWLRHRRSRYLPDEVVSELVLIAWLFEEDGFRSHVKDSGVLLA